jgi:GNAT superfamily N-acetyltransferase
MSSFDIRILGPDDWAVWREVRLRSLADAPDAFGAKLADWQGVNDREDRWRTRFDNVAFTAVAVAHDERQVVGAVGAMHSSPGAIELVSMWVAPEARGTGVGEALIERVFGWAVSVSIGRVMLNVRRINRPAVALYQRAGFALVGPNPDDDIEDTMMVDITDRVGG